MDLADAVDDHEFVRTRTVADDVESDMARRNAQSELLNSDAIVRNLRGRAMTRDRPIRSGIPPPSPVRSVELQVVPYDRGNHPVTGKKNPCHWAIFAHMGPGTAGTVYQLRGMPGAFSYDGPEKNVDLAHFPNQRQEVEIGRVPSDKIRDMEVLIANVPISRSESGYNCQTWTEDVLAAMQPHGWLDLSPSAVAQWLRGLES